MSFRIVHLGKYYPPSSGGIESHTQTLARAQSGLGCQVRVVVVNHAGRNGADATFSRFTRTREERVTDQEVEVVRVGRIANLAKVDVSPGLAKVIRKELRNPPDVWHLHTPNVTMMMAVLATPQVRPLVITHHSDIVRQRFTKHVVRPFERAVYRRADRILPTSARYIDESSLLESFREKLTPIPLGIDLNPYLSPSGEVDSVRERIQRAHGGPLWLMIGRLIYYKGVRVALSALKQVPGKLLVIGTGPLSHELKELASELGVADRVIWYGHARHTEVLGAYRAATALWFPSIARSEAFGLVQVEAMASGCPVINTAIPGSGVPWVCRDNVEGLTVPVDDPAQFARAVNRLLTEPELRDRLAEAGRRRAVEEFDWKTMASRTLRVYQQLGRN